MRVRVAVLPGARGAAALPRLLRARARGMLAALGLGEAELSVVLAGDDEMRRLNRRAFGRRSPTDVIAFPQASAAGLRGPPAVGQPLVLGDIVVNVDRARAFACDPGGWARGNLGGRALAWSAGREATLLLAHGLLHLLGGEDASEAGRRRMRRGEAELLAPFLSRRRRSRGEPRAPSPRCRRSLRARARR